MGYKSLIGQRFGRLLVVSLARYRAIFSGYSRRMWNCKCECGARITLPTSYLTRGTYRSCGCLHKEIASKTATKIHTKHNCSKEYPKQYNVWKGIRQRCYNPNNPEYHCYGGKGVAMCDEWKLSPTAFCQWWESQCPELDSELTIDRINSDGDYEPSNCQLISRSENSAKKTTMWFTVNDVTKTCAEWSRVLGRGHGYLQRIWRRDGEASAYNRLINELKSLDHAQ